MALTELELGVCNQALGLIGQKEIVYTDTGTSDTGTAGVNYNRLDLIYPQTRNALLRMFEWNFASARLALVGTWTTGTYYTTDQYVWVDSVLYKCNEAHTSTTWNTDYVMDGTEYVMDGTDYVRDDNIDFKWDIVDTRAKTYWSYIYDLPADFIRFKLKWLKHNETRFNIEGRSILTNETSLNINYIQKVTDTTLFDELFNEVLIYDLAIKLTFPILGAGYPAQAMRRDLQAQRQRTMLKARQICSAEVEQSGEYTWTNARYGSGQV
jgi:hypothetical protein